MPGSTTTRDRRMARNIVMRRIAFYWTESIGTPKLFYAAQWPGLRNPLSTLRLVPHGTPRMTRNRCDSLRLHLRTLTSYLPPVSRRTRPHHQGGHGASG
jgi:hypothetical protein